MKPTIDNNPSMSAEVSVTSEEDEKKKKRGFFFRKKIKAKVGVWVRFQRLANSFKIIVITTDGAFLIWMIFAIN